MSSPNRNRTRLAHIVLTALLLLMLVPVISSSVPFGDGAPGPLDGVANAAECVTTCKSYDELVKSWENVHGRQAAVDQAAATTGVPANLIKAIMKLESNGLNLLPNGASAVGPMQVTISNWGYWAYVEGLDLYNADQNIMAGAKILDRFRVQYLDWANQHGIDPWLTALYSYYAGNPYNLLARDSPAQGGSGITTQEYGARIWHSYQFLQDQWPMLVQAKLQPGSELRANGGANPARAMDGDLDTSWAVIGQNGPPPGSYLQIDLGEPTRIFEISWAFRSTGYADRLRIRISDDGVNYETIHTTGNAPVRTWQYLMIDRSARYVRFNVDNPNGDAAIGYIAEVAIRGVKASQAVLPPVPQVAFALSASGGSAGATHTGRIRDGKLNTSWYTTGDPRPASGFVYIDLGSEQRIGLIEWVFSKSGGAPLLEIQTSNDKRTWTTVGTAGNAPAGEWQFIETDSTGRYVRWLVTNTTGVQQIGYIAEVRVKNHIGPSVTPTPEVETPPIHALPGSGGSAGATFTGRVRDGRLDTDWRTTGAPRPASGFVYVDLGGDQAISAVEWVFSQTGGAPLLLIESSFDKLNWTTIGTAGDAPAGEWQRLDASLTARYIRWMIVNTTGVEQIGFIAEVRVIGVLNEATPTPEPTATGTPEPTPTSTVTPGVPETVDTSMLPASPALPIATSSDSAGSVTANAIDGVLATTWQVSGNSGWLLADIGASFALKHIAWLASESECAANLTLEVSADGVDWNLSAGFSSSPAWTWQVASVEVEGRYVRWSFAGAGDVVGCLSEVAIWGTESALIEPADEPTATPTEEEPLAEVATETPTEPAATETPITESTVEVPTEVPTEAPTEAQVELPVDPTTEPNPETPAQGEESGD